jgi:hypothetical protein
MTTLIKRCVFLLLCTCCLALAGCDANVGVGLSVGVPIGNNGYISIGGGRWY